MKNPSPKIYLGIDPGTTRIGYGIVRDDGGFFTCLDYGIIDNPGVSRTNDYVSTNISIHALVKKYHPAAAAVERLFFFKNQKTVMSVSEMRGVIMLSLAQAGIFIHEFTPMQIKLAICNYGMADKRQVQRMVRTLLKLEDEIKPDDAADALALAIACAGKI